ncbi:MAG: 50S ribosomal protein L11 [Chloroflexota bacterium]|nr:50S ribosomal protein L11 [Chloroflexota bacterium]MDP6507520.1 50S ribosomal protein L11 [Chloroflexota bacterium]MDP6757292.1 50S ribosomal protein L11 [Chloroflexota bacterium]
MAKKVLAVVKMQLDAGAATVAPPVGPSLGQHGVNSVQFVKEYNERTQSQAGSIIPCEVTVYADRSYSFITKTPPTSDLLRKAAGVEAGSGSPREEKVGEIVEGQLAEIAKIKMPDLNANDIEAAKKIVAGTARSMGITIADWED